MGLRQAGDVSIEAASTSRRIAVQTLSDLQAKAAAPNVRQMLGQLHLSASMWSAVEGPVLSATDVRGVLMGAHHGRVHADLPVQHTRIGQQLSQDPKVG